MGEVRVPRISQIPWSSGPYCSTRPISASCSAQELGSSRRHLAGLLQSEHDLAEDVPLVLARRFISDTHRRCPTIARQRLHRPLGEPALARQPVHDLHVAGIAGEGPEKPVAPGVRLCGEAMRHEHAEGQRRVPEPDVAVVPIPAAAESLRQARGRRRHDTAGLRITQRAQDEQGAMHARRDTSVPSCTSPRSATIARCPGSAGHLEGTRRSVVRRVPGEGDVDGFALRRRSGSGPCRTQRRSAHDHGIRSGNRDQCVRCSQARSGSWRIQGVAAA